MKKKETLGRRLKRDFLRYKGIYFIMFPVLFYYIVFHYIPMGGTVIAFQDYRPALGFLESDWVGLENFIEFFTGPYAWRTIRNTILLSLYGILFEFPMPIILALMINEVSGKIFKRTVQTISYLPHFISLVVVCGIIFDFTNSDGLINVILGATGPDAVNLLSKKEFFRAIYVVSDIWKNVGWGSIIYLSTLSGIDPNLYEAAAIDGAGRVKQLLHITLPSLIPIISVQLILRIGRMMSLGYEKVILLYNPLTYETADIISSFVYRVGLVETNYSLGAAVGVFNSVINLALLCFANWFSKSFVKESLW